MNKFRLYPQGVVWEITFACSMRCLHCGTSAGKKRPDELNTQESLNLIDELASLGTEHVTLSGGEPLMREDWPVLARRIREKGMQPLMVTNGLAVTEEIVEQMASVPFGTIGVSLDGGEKTHNYIRQRDDSFAGAVNAIKLMAKRNAFKVSGITQVSNINLNELDNIRQTLIDAGCRLWRVQLCTSTGRMEGLRDLVLSLENYPKLLNKMPEFQKWNDEIEMDVGENIGYYGQMGTQLAREPYLGCYAGTRVAGIESNGNVKGCLSMPERFVEGNIREKSFTEIWNSPDGFIYNRKFTKETAAGFCHDCRYLPLCRGGCTTTSVSASNCRADNPYCIYRMEQARGIPAPPDDEYVARLLQWFESQSAKNAV